MCPVLGFTSSALISKTVPWSPAVHSRLEEGSKDNHLATQISPGLVTSGSHSPWAPQSFGVAHQFHLRLVMAEVKMSLIHWSAGAFWMLGKSRDSVCEHLLGGGVLWALSGVGYLCIKPGSEL